MDREKEFNSLKLGLGVTNSVLTISVIGAFWYLLANIPKGIVDPVAIVIAVVTVVCMYIYLLSATVLGVERDNVNIIKRYKNVRILPVFEVKIKDKDIISLYTILPIKKENMSIIYTDISACDNKPLYLDRYNISKFIETIKDRVKSNGKEVIEIKSIYRYMEIPSD